MEVILYFRYLLASMDSENLKLSYVSCGMNKDSTLHWIQHMKDVSTLPLFVSAFVWLNSLNLTACGIAEQKIRCFQVKFYYGILNERNYNSMQTQNCPSF